MTIQKRQLLESLKKAMPGVETGSVTLQGSDTFVFHDGKIFTYNDSISVSIPIEQSGLIEEKVEGAVKSDEFFKIISKFPGDEINFSVSENNSWVLKSGKARAEMTLIDFDFTKRLEGICPDEEWKPITEDFISGLSCCQMSANKSPYSGIFISQNNIISTDGWTMNRYTMKETTLPDFWLSENSVNELLKIKNFIQFQLQGTWAHFRTEDNTIFSIKTLQVEKYPVDKINSVLNKSTPKEGDIHSTFPESLFKAIDRATSFSIDISEHSAVRIELKPENITVSSERNSGKYLEDISWDVEVGEFEPFLIYVDAGMIQSVANHSLQFYLLKGPLVNGKQIPRLLFTTDSSVHLMSTLDCGE